MDELTILAIFQNVAIITRENFSTSTFPLSYYFNQSDVTNAHHTRQRFINDKSLRLGIHYQIVLKRTLLSLGIIFIQYGYLNTQQLESY